MNKVNFDRRSSAWLVAFASLACLGCAQVLAAAPMETHSVVVRYGDLDITTSAGAAALYHRIQGAARMTCGYGFEDVGLAAVPSVNRCNRSAISGAVASVNSPLLTAIHEAHYGRRLTAMLDE